MKMNLFWERLLLAISTVMIVSCSKDEIIENETELLGKPDQISITPKIIDLGT